MCAEWEKRRIELDYEIDGIVIKVDSLEQQRRLGALHGRPRWSRAFKWAPMTAQTKLNKIHIRVGRTGALNPWAQLEPVEVGGVTVSQATLHNEEDINRKDIREGDLVIVQRAGDVIPQVVGPVLPHQRGTKPFRMPEKCPLCGAEVVKPEGEAMHRCPNRACESRGLETLINWVRLRGHRRRRRAARSAGSGRAGWSLAARALPADEGAAARARGLRGDSRDERDRGDRAVEDERRSARVLFGLNIPDVGWVTAQNLARHFGSVDALAERSQEEIQEVEGIGPERAEAIAEWFSDDENRELVDELRELGLRSRRRRARPVEGPLTGRRTSSRGRSRRSPARGRTALEAKGAKVAESVSKKTTGVIVGEEPGLEAARRPQRPACRSSTSRR